MTRNDPAKHTDTTPSRSTERSKDTHSGTPNPVDPKDHRTTEHKSGYGGDGGSPRTSSDEQPPKGT